MIYLSSTSGAVSIQSDAIPENFQELSERKQSIMTQARN